LKTDIDFDFAEYGEEWNEQLENLVFLCSAIEGTCPGDREFGLSSDILDNDIGSAEAEYVLSLTEKMEKYTPLLELVDIQFFVKDGETHAILSIEPLEDYEDEED